MKNLSLLSVVSCLFLYSSVVSAHISWSSIAGVNCPAQYSCREAPITLNAGTTISVVYDVVIQHGAPVEIDISYGEDGSKKSTLKSNLPENSGLNTTTITLPKKTCEVCTLTVRGSGYTGEVKIKLEGSVTGEDDLVAPADVEALVSIAEDNQVHLMWENPQEDFAGVLIIKTDQASLAHPERGQSYEPGEIIEGAEVVFAGSSNSWVSSTLERNTRYYYKVFAMDAAHNYSNGIEEQVLTTDVGNNPPWVSLELYQGSEHVHGSVDPDNGKVSVIARVRDADMSDSHSLNWFVVEDLLVNSSDQQDQFVFDPVNLDDGVYEIKVAVVDSGSPALTSEAELAITVVQSLDQGVPSGKKTSRKGGGISAYTLLMTILLSLFLGRRQLIIRLGGVDDSCTVR